jgi:hypothetical protein
MVLLSDKNFKSYGFNYYTTIPVEGFKRALSLSVTNDRPEEIIEKAPLELLPEEIASYIFEKSYKYDISLLLDAVQKRYPEFVLSSFNRIRRAIIEDKSHQITNAYLDLLFEENALSEQERQECYDLAYLVDHPYLYRRATTITLPTDYILNFLWINLNSQDLEKNQEETVFGEDGEVAQKFMLQIREWAEKNCTTAMNLWCDRALVTQKAWDQTEKRVQEIAKLMCVDLRLRDIRELPNMVGGIQEAFHPATPVYFRVDLCKALIADYLLFSTEGAKYTIVLDGDIEPMTPQEIFDERTLDYLAKDGYVFNRVGCLALENSFMIFNKEKKQASYMHRKLVIKPIANEIERLRRLPIDTLDCTLLGSESVFNQYEVFVIEMDEPIFDDKIKIPRKVVKCPKSQFDFGGTFVSDLEDHRNERWRFVGESPIPHTINGRSNARFSK